MKPLAIGIDDFRETRSTRFDKTLANMTDYLVDSNWEKPEFPVGERRYCIL